MFVKSDFRAVAAAAAVAGLIAGGRKCDFDRDSHYTFPHDAEVIAGARFNGRSQLPLPSIRCVDESENESQREKRNR